MKKKFNLIFEQLMNQLSTVDNNTTVDKQYKYQNMTLVALPGSFKPPHKGHWQMIMKYCELPKVQQVHVFISNVSSKVLSNKLLSKSNLNPLFKIISKFNDQKDTYTNKNLVHKLDECFNQIQSKVNDLTYSSIVKYINNLVNTFNEVKTSQFDQLIDKLYKFEKHLQKIIFSNVRVADGDIQIEPETCKKILEFYAQIYGVSDRVIIEQPKDQSPMLSALHFVNDQCQNCIVYLGASKKGGDDTRWQSMMKAFDDNPTNTVESVPVDVKTNLSATTLRNNIHNLKKEWFPDKLSNQQFEEVKKMLLD